MECSQPSNLQQFTKKVKKTDNSLNRHVFIECHALRNDY